MPYITINKQIIQSQIKNLIDTVYVNLNNRRINDLFAQNFPLSKIELAIRLVLLTVQFRTINLTNCYKIMTTLLSFL